MIGKIWPVLAAALLLLVLHLFISPAFPVKGGSVAADYIYYFPRLLDGYFWAQENGYFSMRWFNPSSCGGIPAFPDPQDLYFSVVQIAFNLFGPIPGVYLSFLLSSALGLAGCYALLTRGFSLGRWAALAGCSTFLFSGFWIERLLSGQAQHLAFGLWPLLAYCLVAPPSEGRIGRWWSSIGYAVAAAAIIAYMFVSGMVSIMVPLMLGVVAIGILHSLRADGVSPFWFRLGVSLVGAGLLSASKLAAAMALLGQFPRNQYLLPGYEGGFHTLGLLIRSLIGLETDLSIVAKLTNSSWALGENEYRFGLGPVAMVLIAIAVIAGLRVQLRQRQAWSWIGAGALLAVLLVPLVVNIYDPDMNRLLKTIPFLGSYVAPSRWWCAYTVIGAVAVAIAVDLAAARPWAARVAAVACAVSAVWTGGLVNAGLHRQEAYVPAHMVRAHALAKEAGHGPAITKIIAGSKNGQVIVDRAYDEAVVEGGSHLYCYQTLFGYKLEWMPVGRLRPGWVMFPNDGVFNIKNPACYVYPGANSCRPGDHFKVGEDDAVRDFIARRPFPFAVPASQSAANMISGASLAGLALFGAALLWRWLRRRGPTAK
ncbi:hypothetical protein [Magnetospirillum sp. XM-1]|uniref:hypothetical protein n=1 Tax=Magnetospirillum sp. XM-1 TaxID=1663591 RepID=UPI00083904B6|nr:hypothetical protein [Magnetospirillum sp. XM-1]